MRCMQVVGYSLPASYLVFGVSRVTHPQAQSTSTQEVRVAARRPPSASCISIYYPLDCLEKVKGSGNTDQAEDHLISISLYPSTTTTTTTNRASTRRISGLEIYYFNQLDVLHTNTSS